MEKLSEYIKANRSNFDTNEPSEGHFDRFRSKLAFRVPEKRTNLFLVASAAAVAGIIIAASLTLLLTYSDIGAFNNFQLTGSNLSPEVTQIDEYYKKELLKKENIIYQLMATSSQQNDEITRTLFEMNVGNKNLLEDIASTPNNERAAYTIMLHYQAKLKAMEMIISKLQNIATLTDNH